MGRVSQEEVSMPTDDVLESVRVIKKTEAQRLTGVSPDTWDRMEARGDAPPRTRISATGWLICGSGSTPAAKVASENLPS